jgi:branched-chain amino acid transport system substrate-binding protein
VSRGGSGHRVGRCAVSAAFALAFALGLTACGRSHRVVGNRIAGHTLTIYSSLPLRGRSAAGAQSVLDGERLALAQAGGHVGDYGIQLRWLDDATPQRGGWDPGQTTINVNLALKDPSTIGYLGDFNSGATAVAVPLLNRLGVPTISPTSTAVGLTSNGPEASPGEPAKYYPTGKRTLVRLAPDDARAARVQVRLQLEEGCSRTLVLDDGRFDGYDGATAFALAARSAGLHVVGPVGYDPRGTDYRSLLRGFTVLGVDCAFLSAAPESHAALIAGQLARLMPRVQIFGPGELAQPGFTSPAENGLPIALDRRVQLVVPAPGSGAMARSFAADYARQFGAVTPYAYYGFAAMRILLAAIAVATHGGHHVPERSEVIAALMAMHEPDSAVGPFAVSSDGATTLDRYVVYGLAGGRLVRDQVLAAH